MTKKTETKGKSISKEVGRILQNKPFIKDVFLIDAVNYSGLARHLIPELEKKFEKKVNVEAVVMAIRRFADKLQAVKLSADVKKHISKFDINLKNDIVEVSLPQTKHCYDAVLGVYSGINWTAGETMSILQSAGEIAVLIDKKNYNSMLKEAIEEDLLHIEQELGLIVINTGKEIIDFPGVLYTFLGLLAENDISVIDAASTFTKFLFIIREKDATRAYDIFQKFIKNMRNSDSA